MPRDAADQRTIQLLGERMIEVKRSQARFDVRYWNPRVKSSQRSTECRRRIALDNYARRFFTLQHRLETRDDACGRLRKRLRGTHQVQIVMWRNAEQLEHLIQQSTMLCSDTDASFEAPGGLRQLRGQRRELDRLRPSPKYKQDAGQAESLLVTVGNAALGEIVGRHFKAHTIAR